MSPPCSPPPQSNPPPPAPLLQLAVPPGGSPRPVFLLCDQSRLLWRCLAHAAGQWPRGVSSLELRPWRFPFFLPPPPAPDPLPRPTWVVKSLIPPSSNCCNRCPLLFQATLKRYRPPRPDWYEEVYAKAMDQCMKSYESEVALAMQLCSSRVQLAYLISY